MPRGARRNVNRGAKSISDNAAHSTYYFIIFTSDKAININQKRAGYANRHSPSGDHGQDDIYHNIVPRLKYFDLFYYNL